MIPYLGGTIKKIDITQKGEFDYVPWSKICNYLNQTDHGIWQPGIRLVDGLPYVKCGNSAAVLVYFKEYETNRESPDWLYEITDYRNQPIPLDKLTCSDVHRAHKRAICSAAAGFFSLGYEVFARLELDSIEEGIKKATTLQSPSQTTTVQAVSSTSTQKQTTELPEPASSKERDLVTSQIMVLFNSNKKAFSSLEADYRSNFKVPASPSFSSHIQQKDHLSFIADWFVKNASLVRA